MIGVPKMPPHMLRSEVVERGQKVAGGQRARFFMRDGVVWVEVTSKYSPTCVPCYPATDEDKQRFAADYAAFDAVTVVPETRQEPVMIWGDGSWGVNVWGGEPPAGADPQTIPAEQQPKENDHG